MTDQSQPLQPSLHVKTPCPKTWGELAGDDAKRYCSECSLHVLNSVRLTRTQAHELVAHARERVCMRMELDSTGAPVFLDSPRRAESAAPTLTARVTRWALGAAAGLLAACGRHETVGRVAATPPPPETSQAAALLGRVAPLQVMGDVACTPAQPPAQLPAQPPALLGEVSGPTPVEPPVGATPLAEPPTAPTPPNDGDARKQRAR